jgi:transcription initiation factor TFIIE subunit alpha
MYIIDTLVVPEVTGPTAMRDRVEVPKEKSHLDAPSIDPFNVPKAKPQTVKGILSGPEKIEVAITTASESTAAQQAANAANKAKTAAQNQLPEWHTHSTVTNEMTAAGQREEAARREREMEMGAITSEKEEQKAAAQGELDAVFAMIDAQREAAMEVEEEESEEEEDEFEDVVAKEDTPPEAKKIKLSDDVAVSSAADTPAADAEDSEDGDEFEDAIN